MRQHLNQETSALGQQRVFGQTSKSGHQSQSKGRLRRGLTLLEMMIVLAIIGIIMGGVASKIIGFRDAAKMNQTDADFRMLGNLLEQYRNSNGHYPSNANDQGLKALYEKPTSSPVPKRWNQLFKEIPTDPWGRPYLYEYSGSGRPVIISQGIEEADESDDLRSDNDV